jgi:hypothetical protein
VKATHGTVHGVKPNPFEVPAKASASAELEFEKTPVAFLIAFGNNLTAHNCFGFTSNKFVP